MRKRLDAIFSALMLLAAIAVVVAGGWCLAHSIVRAKAEPIPAPALDPVHIMVPAPEPLPTPTSTPPPVPEPTVTPFYSPTIPLSGDLQQVIYETCEEEGIPVSLVLSTIQWESGFDMEIVSEKGCYGLMQLNSKYFPLDLSPADNLRTGIAYMADLLERYGDTAAALTAYHAGYDTGSRLFAGVVLADAEWWEDILRKEVYGK